MEIANNRRSSTGPTLSAVLLLTALLHLPGLCWPVACDDEGTYEAMAHVINRGGVMYKDALDHKPPGLAYTYAAVQRITGTTAPSELGLLAVHALGVLVAVLTAWGLTLVARQFLPPALAAWPALVYAVSSSAKFAWDGVAVNGEVLMNLPTVFALWAVLRGRTGRGALGWDVLAGALVGVAALFKWQGLVLGLAFPFFCGAHPRTVLTQMRRGPAWLLGLALPLLTTAAYFAHRDALREALRWGLLFNLQYIGEGPTLRLALEHLGGQLLTLVLPVCIIYALGLRALRLTSSATPARAAVQPGLVVWTLACVYCVGVGGRFFGHYFLQLELCLALLAAEPLADLWARQPRLVGASLAVPALAFFVFGLSPTLTRAINMDSQPNWARLGAQLEAHLQPQDTLFIWGNTPMLYHFTHRPLGTRFAFCNYLTGLSPASASERDAQARPDVSAQVAWPELLTDLAERRPSVILDTATAGWKAYGKFPLAAYPPLADYVARHYRRDTTLDGADVYRRILD